MKKAVLRKLREMESKTIDVDVKISDSDDFIISIGPLKDIQRDKAFTFNVDDVDVNPVKKSKTTKKKPIKKGDK